MSSQDAIPLEHMRRGRTVTPALAHALVGTFACHSNMDRIRKLMFNSTTRYDVRCQMMYVGKKKWGVYSLPVEQQHAKEA